MSNQSPDQSDCRHRDGWGLRWTGERYCLGCGLPLTAIAQRAYETLSCVLRAGDHADAQVKLDALARQAGVTPDEGER